MVINIDLQNRDEARAALKRLAELGVLYEYRDEDGIIYYGQASTMAKRGLISDAIASVDGAGNVQYGQDAAGRLALAVEGYNHTNREIAKQTDKV